VVVLAVAAAVMMAAAHFPVVLAQVDKEIMVGKVKHLTLVLVVEAVPAVLVVLPEVVVEAPEVADLNG
jgi:hypothetical protein